MAKLQTCDKHVETFINLLSDAGSIPATSIITIDTQVIVCLLLTFTFSTIKSDFSCYLSLYQCLNIRGRCTMAEFENLPTRIQQLAKAELQQDEKIHLCVLGRSSLLLPDFVLITSQRVLVLDEKFIGSIAVSYANIRCNLLFSDIISVKLARMLKHRLFGQARLEIYVKRNIYWIDNMSFHEAMHVQQFITEQIGRYN